MMETVHGFLPSSHGFWFRNAWPRGTPTFVVETGVGSLRFGDANSGLCGGMALAVADLHAAGRRPRRWTTPPVSGTDAFRYLTRRLIDSWGIPAGPARFAYWAVTPDHDTVFGLRAGTRRMTIDDELPRIEAGIGRQRPVLLGLVTVRSAAPAQLAKCHIVLAYGCTRTAGVTRIAVYDPNSPRRDDIAIVVATTDGGGPAVISHNVGIRRPIRGVFVLPYRTADPAPVAGPHRAAA